MPVGEKRERVNLMLDPELRAAAKARGLNLSERVNALLRKDLGL
ncbi:MULTISPECIES: type II toxin-antitoxin system CcdA family antitoxin [unclassified Roseobacter]|nr:MULTISPECIES: type II toxin-antitoxin system CcdA family antitoxin [unclassified Roseobacter]